MRSSLSQTHSGIPLLQGIPPEPQVVCGILPLFETIPLRKISNCMVKGRGSPFNDSRAVSSTLRNSICGFYVYCIAERMRSLFRGNFTTSSQPHHFFKELVSYLFNYCWWRLSLAFTCSRVSHFKIKL